MKKITPIFMGVLLIAIVVYDVLALMKGGTEASISHWIIVSSYKYPIFTFLAGLTCGHLFWRMRYTKDTKRISDSTREE